MLLFKIKKTIPEKWKRWIKLLFVSSNDPQWTYLGNKDKQVIYIFLAGFYQNIGDMSITYAQKSYLQQLYPESEIVTISSTCTYNAVKTIKKIIRPRDIITLIGGGNMDDVYISLEEARLHVVKSFPNNKIISFPQTFSFSDSVFGKKRQEISHRVYSKHKCLTLFVREPYSLKRIKEAFYDVNIGYCPDIVLSLNKIDIQHVRHGVLCCFRSDIEQNIHSEYKDCLIKTVSEEFHDVLLRDTVDVSLEDCQEDRYEQTLKDFLDLLRHKAVVITDRLHCMIFCVVTRTPCVVIDNTNHKVAGVYNAWLKEIPFIKFVEYQDIETIISIIKGLYREDFSNYNYDFTDEFAPLRKALYE